ncbi:MAG: type 4a pilus biogenesis protein PilO [Nitrospirota bacterium]
MDRIRALAANPATKRLRVIGAICVGLIALNLLVYAFAVAPAVERLAKGRRQYAETKREHAEAVLFQKQKKLLSGLIEGIPTQKDVPLLIKELMQTARRLHLAVDAVSSDIPTPGASGLTMLTFTFPASGAYADVKRFIYEVETSKRLVGIQDLKLSSEKGRVKLQLKLVTYIRGE